MDDVVDVRVFEHGVVQWVVLVMELGDDRVVPRAFCDVSPLDDGPCGHPASDDFEVDLAVEPFDQRDLFLGTLEVVGAHPGAVEVLKDVAVGLPIDQRLAFDDVVLQPVACGDVVLENHVNRAWICRVSVDDLGLAFG